MTELWALIVGIGGSLSGVSSHVIYFNTQERCEVAREVVNTANDLPASAVCVQGVIK